MKEPLRVLHLVEALGGGVYSYFCDLSHFFGDQKGFKTYIAYNDKRNEVIPEKIRADIHENVELIKFEIEKSISPYSDLKSIIKFRKLIHKLNPDIVHVHSSKAGVVGRIGHYLSSSSSKLFYTPHGFAFLRKDIGLLQKRSYSFIEVAVKKLTNGVTISCGDTEHEYASKIGNSLLVRNGINIEKIREHFRVTDNKQLTVGILGRITFARNPEMFNKIAENCPNIKFLWIGDGELRDLITSKNIEVTGWFADRNAGLNYLNKIDIYLQTSLWEGLPISLLEAMAFEKPVLATNIVGNKDVVDHGITGYLFSNEDECLKYIEKLNSKKIRDEMGRNGLKKIMEKFDCLKNFRELSQVYYSP